MSQKPVISIVIAVRNGANTIQSALDSVFEQTYGTRELIVIDGASTDETPAILERNATRMAHWESKPDRGVYHAWNKALQHVSGDWICFLGADDRFAGPAVLSDIAAELSDLPAAIRIAYARIRLIAPDGSSLGLSGEPWSAIRSRFLRGMAIPHQATYHHKDLFARLGGFDESFAISGDYELLLRELIHNDPAFIPNVVAVEMGTSGLSSRPENRLQRITEFERARRMHGLASGPVWLAPAVVRTWLRAWIRRLGPRPEAAAASLYRTFRKSARR